MLRPDGTEIESPAMAEADTASKQKDLVVWLDKNGLGRHSKAIMDPTGSVGLAGLQDLLDLSDEDIDEVIKDLGLNIGEKNRLNRGIALLREELTPDPPEEAPAMASASAPAKDVKKSRANFSRRLGASNGYNSVAETVVAEEFFEVVEKMVFVRSAPQVHAQGVGILRQGAHIQVCGRHRDSDGNEWVQLSEAEFWRSCEPESGIDIKTGFALIHGESLGLGRLLRGPLSEHEVLPSSAPSPEAVAQAMLQRQHAKPEISYEQQQMMLAEQRESQAKRRIEQERHDKQIATAEALERAKAHADTMTVGNGNQLAHREGTQPPTGAVALRSTGQYIFTKLSQDPSSQKIVRMECRPGTTFYVKEGSEWQGPQGGLWMEHALKSCWLLIEDSGHGGTLLLNEADSSEHATVKIDCLTSRGDIRVFEAFVNVKTTVKSLNAFLCHETGLKPKGTFLFANRPPVHGVPRKQDVMQATESLLSHSVLPNTVMTLYLLYPFNFEGDYRGGAYMA